MLVYQQEPPNHVLFLHDSIPNYRVLVFMRKYFIHATHSQRLTKNMNFSQNSALLLKLFINLIKYINDVKQSISNDPKYFYKCINDDELRW